MEVHVIYWSAAALALLLAAAALGTWMQKKRVKRSKALRMAARTLACAGVICGAVSVIVGINDHGASTKKPLPTEEPALTASGEMGETAADAAAPIDAEAAVQEDTVPLADMAAPAESVPAETAQPLRIDGTASDAPVLNGATALGPVYEAFMEKVYDPLPEDRSALLYVDTTPAAYEALLNRTADVIFVADPSEEQRAEAESRGLEMVFTPFAREAFVFFVDNHNYIGNLTAQQVRDIYSGRIADWSEVGGDAGPITAYQRNPGSGSQSMMLRFMGGDELMEAPGTETMGSIIMQVADYEAGGGSIGYSFRYYFTEMVGNDQTHMLNLDGVAPTVENIQNGTYPALTTVYAVYLADNENPLVRRLCEWTTSDEARAIVEQIGYVPYAEPSA